MTPITLRCARHECSCTPHDVYPPDPDAFAFSSDKREMMLPKATSNITIDGKRCIHPAPSLTIGLAALMSSSPRRDPATALNNSIDFWADARSFTDTNTFYFNGRPSLVDAHWNNGTVLDRQTIERTGRCVSEDAYQWGFPSLLLRTFCSATIAFAIVLIPAADRRLLEQQIRPLPPVALPVHRHPLPRRGTQSRLRSRLERQPAIAQGSAQRSRQPEARPPPGRRRAADVEVAGAEAVASG